MGSVDVRKADQASIAYVMKYLDKWINKKQDWRKTPEYNTMSEGIGIKYIEKNAAWHIANLDVLYVTTPEGIKVPMPKYYRLKMFNEQQRVEQMLLVEQRLLEIKNEEIENWGEEVYSIKQNRTRKFGELVFKKKTKKRTIE